MLTPADFKARWWARTGTERGLAQAHFLDLRAMLGQDIPGAPDYVFEQPVTKAGGGQGFADVWKPGHFAIEYKRENRDLRAAYQQLLAYKDALANPPLLVVSDLKRIVLHPNFPNTTAEPYEIGIDEIDDPEKLAWLRWLFTEPERLRRGTTREDVTKAAAARFGAIAAGLTARGEDPARVAHLLVQLLFCLFAEDVGVLPKGLVKKTFDFGARHPEAFDAQLRALRDDPADHAGSAEGAGDQRVRAGAGAGGDLDRVPAVDDRQRVRVTGAGAGESGDDRAAGRAAGPERAGDAA